MKSLFAIVLLAAWALALYCVQAPPPYLGEWRASKTDFLRSAGPQALSDPQRAEFDRLLDRVRISINAQQIRFQVPQGSGSFDYSATAGEDGCYLFDIRTLGQARLCLQDAQLVLSMPSGVTEYYERI